MSINAQTLLAHRGPFLLTGTRENAKHELQSCTLAKDLERDDVLPCAETFLTDPRDTIRVVFVWATKPDYYCIGSIRHET